MERKLSFILLIMLLIFGCKGKPETQTDASQEDQVVYEETTEPQEPEPADSTPQKSPLSKYEYTWSGSDDMPDIVIIVDDFGNSGGKLLEDFADLPQEIVFAVLPDLSHSKTAAEIAARKGHEVIIHVPMEAENSSVSPGKKFISKNMEEDAIQDVLDDFIAQMPMAIAANNHMGSAATASLSTMNHVIGHLKAKGLFFIDSATTAQSAVFSAAKQNNAFSARRDIFLDVPDNSDATLADKIQSLGKYKGRREPVIIITHCHNREKLDALRKFITQVESMGIRIVSLRDAFPQART